MSSVDSLITRYTDSYRALDREFHRAPGVVNVVFDGRETGDALVRHPLVQMGTFTGSDRAGTTIRAACGEAFKRMTLELGGKSATLVLDDADLDSTLAAIEIGNFRNAGRRAAG